MTLPRPFSPAPWQLAALPATLALLLLAPASHAQWVVSGTETLSNPATPLPASVNNPVMWIDASAISSLTLNGNHISAWDDLTGNGRHLTRADLFAQPSIGINPATGHAAVFFDGRDVLANSFNVGTPYTIFTASNQAGSLNARLITSTSNNWLLGYWGGGENRMFAEGWVLGSGGPAATTNPHFYGATGSGSNTSFYDGTTLLASNANGTAAPNGISLGAYANNPGSEPSRGYVSELIIFDRVLSPSEIADLNTYLQDKWSGQGQVLDNTAVVVNAGNTLALNNTAETVGSLSGDGAVTLTNAVLGLGGGGGSATFSGTISGTGSIAKVGAGTQTLSGANSYSGGTQVHQGTLDLGASGNVGSTTSISNVGSHLGAGTLSISGGSLQASSLTLGAEGAGTLNISGGTVSTHADTGFGSLVVGQYHAATVNQSGGTVAVNSSYAILGRYAGSSATYNLSGGTLQTTGDRLRMAWDHSSVTASLNVSGTGQAILNGTILEAAGLGTSTVNVSDNGLIDVINNHIVIGRTASGPATMNLSGNATVQTSGTSGTRDIYLAWDQAGSQGTLNIQDNATLSIAQNFNAASQGTATINQSGGTVSVAGATNLANQNAPGSATLTLSGGTFTTNGVNMARSNTGAEASLNISDGTLVSTSTFEASPRGTATITQTGGLIDVQNNFFVLGRYATGTATMTISDGITQTSGTTGNRRFHVWGDEANALATLTVKGTGQIIVNSQNSDAAGTPGSGFLAGQQGNANIFIQDQARIVVYGVDDSEGAMSLARNGTATVQVSQTGGDVELHNNYFILGRNGTSGGSYDISAGSLQTLGDSGNRRMHLAWDSTTATGTMNLSGTAVVTLNKDNANATGNPGSGFLVGHNGTGTLTVADEARLTVYGVDDLDAALFVALNNGASTFTQTGGTVEIYDGRIRAGRSNSSHGTITVNGGTFTHGLSGTHAPSALPNDLNTFLGWDSANATGIINVGGTGQMSLGADVYAGGNGTAQINVSGQGQLAVDGNIHLAQNASSNASISIAGDGVLSARSIVRDRGTASLTFDGGTLRAHPSGFASNLNMILATGGGRFDSAGQDMLVTGVLSGAGSLTKLGTGDLRLSGSNTYDGDTFIQAGTLRIVRDPGTLFYTFDATDAAGRVPNLGGGGASRDGLLMNGASLSGSSLVIADNSNQYLRVGNQISGLGAPTIGDYTISARYQNLHGTDSWRTLTRASDAAGNGHHIIVENNANNRLGRFQPGFNPTTYTPAIGNASWTEITMVASGGSYSFYIDGTLVGTAGGNPINDIFAIGNFQGGLQPFAEQIDQFRLIGHALSASEVAALFDGSYFDGTSTTVLPDASRVHIAPSATLDLAGNSETIGSLHDLGLSGGTVTSDSPSASTLSIGADHSADALFSGTIQDGTGGSLSLTKAGTGTQTLSGTNTYSGPTTVQQGTLALSTTGSLTSDVSVQSGATFVNNGLVSGNVSIASGGIATGAGTTTGNFAVAGTHRPGNSPGVEIIAGNYILLSTGTLELELDSPLLIVPNAAGLSNAQIHSYLTTTLAWTSGAASFNPTTPLEETFDPLLGDRTDLNNALHDALEIGGDLVINPGGTIKVVSLPPAIQRGIVFDILDIAGSSAALALNPSNTNLIRRGGQIALVDGGVLDLPDLWDNQDWGYYNWDLTLFQSHGILVLVPEPSRPLLLTIALAPLLLRRRRHRP